MGYSLLYLSLIVLIPLSALFVKTATMTWPRFWSVVTNEANVAAYRLTFITAIIGASINAIFGFIVAWSLVRYEFWGRKILDAIVDLPFALPTAVSGIALTTLYAPTGWIGAYLEKWNVSSLRQSLDAWWLPVFEKVQSLPAGGWLSWPLPSDLTIKAAYTPLGVTIAMTFIGLPFVVRTLQPVVEDLDQGIEEAAASLGANRFQTFRRIIFPRIFPSLLTGFALALARALGEYGSVVFIAGNMPMKTEIASLKIIQRLDEFDYAGATAIAVVMLVASFVLLLLINCLQWFSSRRFREGA